MSAPTVSLAVRVRQALTIARVEFRRVFLARRSLWVFGLALLPTIMFIGHTLVTQVRAGSLARRAVTTPALLDSIGDGERLDVMKARLGPPARESWSERSRIVRQSSANTGITTHVIEPVEARFVRLNVTIPSVRDRFARIYEFEVYGPDGPENLALGQPVAGSIPCREDRGPEKAVNGSTDGGEADSWCSSDRPLYLRVDLGTTRPVSRFVVKHASAGGEPAETDTRAFNIQVSTDGRTFTTVESSAGAGMVEERTEYRQVTYFDGRREALLVFVDGVLESKRIRPLFDFEEDRTVFAGIFQYFYLRIAIFFGCLGMFMYLFRGEMANRTLHYWLLAPARREVLLAGKYLAGLIAAVVVFGGGALLAFAAMIWPHDAVAVEAYWRAGGLNHAFWYATSAALGCVGYGSVFLAAGLFLRNPIVPAAVLLAWESIHGIMPEALQRISVLYYLQSLCPVPAPMDADAPALIRLLAAPAAPASRPAAILGLLVLAAIVLWIAGRAARRLQISYGAEA